MLRSGNPALKKTTFKHYGATTSKTMTIQGTVNKTMIMLFILVATATYVWGQPPEVMQTWLMLGGIGGFIVAIILIFKNPWAPALAPVYAALEGLFLGAISSLFELRFPGIVFQATILTFGTLFCLLVAYRSGLIRATENFKLGIFAATGAIGLIYLVGFVMSFFGTGIPYIHESGLVGIGFSLVVVVIAALNLVLDFDFIENGAAQGAPKYMEWYGAFGLLVTLIWLYLEILRLLAKLNSRN